MKLSLFGKNKKFQEEKHEEVFSTAFSSNVGVLLCVAGSISGYPLR